MSYIVNYEKWLKNVKNKEILSYIKSIKDNDAEKQLRFGENLSFGTSGLRGTMGIGTSFVNEYTIAKITGGISNYLNQNFKKPSVVVAYDNRKNSKEWAYMTAKIFAKNNIVAYIFEKLTPTPILSFAVRELKASLGVNITSSHNSKEYNGYKVVDSTGAQVNDKDGANIIKEINKIDEFKVKEVDINTAKTKGLIIELDNFYIDKYIEDSKKYLYDYDFDKSKLNIVYTSFHGTGIKVLPKIIKEVGFKNLYYPENQVVVDEDFSTIKDPNPELPESFFEALKVAKKHKADIIIATDPDCDRLGAVVKHKGKYVRLTGDEVAFVLLDYILQSKVYGKHAFMVSTVVSNELSSIIAKGYGVDSYITLTGFKHMASKVSEIVSKKGSENFIMSYEESCGYMVSDNIRDKDGIIPSVLMLLIAAKLKNVGKTVIDYLNEIYKEFGYYEGNNFSFTQSGANAKAKMNEIIDYYRNQNISTFAGYKVIEKIDYLDKKTTKLPAQNFIEFKLDGGHRVIIRPSGTEPKIKFYITGVANKKNKAYKITEKLRNKINKDLLSIQGK